MTLIDHDTALRLYDYDGNTGILSWKIKHSNSIKIGQQVGSITHKGYLRTEYKGITYGVHRLIWLWVYGEWPNDQIDHINRDVRDNRIKNLRDVNCSTNCLNQRIPKNNTSGVKGVSKLGDKWEIKVSRNGKRKRVGIFVDFNDAVAKREEYDRYIQT